MASYRAIEEGLPMVRATPTGVSAIIDAMGRALPGKRLGIGAFGFIDGPLPGALPPTLYDLQGDGLFFLALALSLVGCAWPELRKRRACPVRTNTPRNAPCVLSGAFAGARLSPGKLS